MKERRLRGGRRRGGMGGGMRERGEGEALARAVEQANAEGQD